MTREQKQLATMLIIGGYYLIDRVNIKRKEGYMLYHGIQEPVKWYPESRIEYFMKYLKMDKRERYTLNLNLVRRMHGKCTLKKLYKNRKHLKAPVPDKRKSRSRKVSTGLPALF